MFKIVATIITKLIAPKKEYTIIILVKTVFAPFSFNQKNLGDMTLLSPCLRQERPGVLHFSPVFLFVRYTGLIVICTLAYLAKAVKLI